MGERKLTRRTVHGIHVDPPGGPADHRHCEGDCARLEDLLVAAGLAGQQGAGRCG
jgi:hypothetical protein